MKKHKNPFLEVAVLCFTLATFVASTASPEHYVKVRDGHFFKGGQRIRLWGINILAHHVKNHQGAETTARRMKYAGFNSVQIWPPRWTFHRPNRRWQDFVPEGEKGSMLDLFDYFVYCVKREGMFVTLPVLTVRRDELTPDVYDLAPDGDIEKEAWWEQIAKLGNRSVRGLKFLDSRITAAYRLQMLWFLNRKNPYTGTRYAEEEAIAFYQLEDELGLWSWPPGRIDSSESIWQTRIKTRWEAFLQQRYGDTDALKEAWGELLTDTDADGNVEQESIDNMKAVMYAGKAVARTPAKRAADAWEFLYSIASTYYDQYFAELRAQAPEGIGCNVVPVAVDSVIYSRPGAFYNTARNSTLLAGAAMAGGGGSLVPEATDDDWWKPPFRKKPPYPAHYSIEPSLLKVKGMPYCPLAGSILVNDPYRAHTPFWRSVWASWQDWDGVYAYWWGYHRDRRDGAGPEAPENVLKAPLYVVSPEHKGAWCIFNDEIQLAAHRLASHIFRNFLLDSATAPAVFRFGRDTLFSPKAADYYHTRWPFMAPTAYARGAEIAFDPLGAYDLKWEGEVVDDLVCPLRWNNGVALNWEQGYTKVDTPRVKAFSGAPSGQSLDFQDGVTVSALNRKHVLFILASDDGRAIKDSQALVYTLVSTSGNTGYKEDISKLQFRQQAGHRYPLTWSIVENEGELPVLVERVSAEINLPWETGIHRKLDFLANEISSERTSGILHVSADEPVFIGMVTR